MLIGSIILDLFRVTGDTFVVVGNRAIDLVYYSMCSRLLKYFSYLLLHVVGCYDICRVVGCYDLRGPGEDPDAYH